MKINITYMLSYFNYLQQYQNVAIKLFELIQKEEIDPNRTIFPFLFLIRHSLELGYKGNIRLLSRYSKINDFCGSGKSHSLRDLHNSLVKHLELAISNLNINSTKQNELKDNFKKLNKVSLYFHIIDDGSYAFRYPRDTDQKPVFPENTIIDISEIKKMFHSTLNLLRYLSEFIINNINTFDENIDWPTAGGVWNDDAVWDDTKQWNDGI